MNPPTSIERHTITAAEIDCTLPGAQHYRVRIVARDGTVEHLPVSIANRGAGPSLLITAGIHGDEFEGPAALLDLVRKLDTIPSCGRLILLPVANPAALAGAARCSPVDGLDLNRSFRSEGQTISAAIANFIVQHLVLCVDAVLDLHAAGRAMIVPSTMIDPRPNDRAGFRRSLGIARAFSADAVLVIEQEETGAMFDGAVMAMGKAFVCAEIGSAAVITPASIALAKAGVARVLTHLGLLSADFDSGLSPRPLLAIGSNFTLRSTKPGFLEPLVTVGADVRAGDSVARVVDTDGASPELLICAQTHGIIYNLAAGGPVTKGGFVALIAQPLPSPTTYDEEALAECFERHLPPYQE